MMRDGEREEREREREGARIAVEKRERKGGSAMLVLLIQCT